MSVDQQLLIRLKNADQAAFRHIFNCYSKKVYHFVLGYVKEPAEAEDITQNVFIKIWSAKITLDIHKSFDGFIFTIAHHMVMDFFRQHNAIFKSESIDTVTNERFVSNSSSDDLLNQHQLESVYKKAVDTLPPRRQQIFLLSRHSGLSNIEIAKFLHISVKTVENQMTAALSALRLFFKDSATILLIIYFLLE